MRSQSGVTFRELSVEHQVQGGDVGRCFFSTGLEIIIVSSTTHSTRFLL